MTDQSPNEAAIAHAAQVFQAFELTPKEAATIARYLAAPRGSRVRIGFEAGEVKIDAGYGWTPGFGRSAQ